MKIKARHVNKVRARGRWYFYHRPTGTRLPGDPGTPEFMARLAELNAQMERAPETVAPGTLEDLIAAYKGAPDFLNRAEKTRKDYGRYLDFLGAKFGDVVVAAIDREFVIELRDALADKPRTADYTLQVLSRILSFAVDRPSRFGLAHNSALRFGRLSDPEGYKPWPDNLIAAFRDTAYAELRWIMEGALYTAQRGEDLVAMAWAHYDGEGIAVAQEKTKKRLWVPVHLTLKKMLKTDIKRRGLVIFTTKTGRPWRLSHLRHEVAKTVAVCGFEAYSLHGLRKNAARNLAEAGASPHEIAAVTGHRTLKMVELYTKEARQKRLAKAAIAKLPGDAT